MVRYKNEQINMGRRFQVMVPVQGSAGQDRAAVWLSCVSDVFTQTPSGRENIWGSVMHAGTHQWSYRVLYGQGEDTSL